MAVVIAVPPGTPASKIGSKPTPTTVDDSHRKLPRPIVFWSLNEKTAYRRNRVVQTRLNMVVDDITNQRESSRRNIRYEAHKFRQKSGKYYSHPSATSGEAEKMNIAPPNWKPNSDNTNKDNHRKPPSTGYSSDEDETNDDIDGVEFSPRRKGLITRAKKPAVKFSMYKQVHDVEDDLKIDDLDNVDQETQNEISPRTNPFIRSSSAVDYRVVPDLPGQSTKRQQSAFPALRRSGNMDANESAPKNTPRAPKNTQRAKSAISNRQLNENKNNIVLNGQKSDTFFDKSKAAYQLRQDLRKKAKLRKQGVKSTFFTLDDALNMEREKFSQTKGRVVAYIKRIEAEKLAERALINKWTQDDIVHQLNI